MRLYILFIICIVCIVESSVWEDSSTSFDNPEIARSFHSSVVYYNESSNQNNIIVYGGFIKVDDTEGATPMYGLRLNDVLSYSLESGIWSTLQNFTYTDDFTVPFPRAFHKAVMIPKNASSFQDCMFVYGGEIRRTADSSIMVALNLSSNNWIMKSDIDAWRYDPEDIAERVAPVFEYSKHDHSLVIFGGRSLTFGTQLLSKVYKFYLDNETWEYIPTDPNNSPIGRGRSGHTVSSDGRYLFVFGGNTLMQIPSPQSYSFDLWRFDLVDHQWTLLSSDMGKFTPPYEGSALIFVSPHTLWLIPYTADGYSWIYPSNVRNISRWHSYQYRLDLNKWGSDSIRESTNGTYPLWSLWYGCSLLENTNNPTLIVSGGQTYSNNTPVPTMNIRLLSFEFTYFEPELQENSQKKKDNIVSIVIPAVIIPVVFLGLGGVLIILLIRRRSGKNRNQLFDIDNHNNIPMVEDLGECIISDIRILERIGGGAFGDVYKGLWQDSTYVACKKLKGADQLQEFRKEAKALKILKHPNIVQFLGIFVDNSTQYIVLEYMSQGSLLQLLQVNKTLTQTELLHLCCDVAAGMMYISDNGLVHRDLALRNILVTNKDGRYIAKISDLGLARASDDQGHYVAQESSNIPWKWTAPESIQYRIYNTKTDVWSFGILAWEILSYGIEPYKGMTNTEAVEKVLAGERMDSPSTTTSSRVYELLLQCWDHESQNRPSFKSIHRVLLEEHHTRA